MVLLIENVGKYQFVRGVFESVELAKEAIAKIDKGKWFGGDFDMHEIELNEIVNII